MASPETPRAVLVRTAPDPTRVIADGELSPACPAAICWGGGGGGAAAAVLLRPERPAPGSWLGGPSGPALVRYTFNDAPIVNRSAMQIGTFQPLDQSEIAIGTYFGVDCYLFSRHRTRALDSALDICHHSSAVFTSFTGFSQGPPVTILSPMSPPSPPRACRLYVRERGARLASRSAPPT